MSEIAMAAGAPHRSSTFKVLAAASIGNALEWYDILAYGYFAVTISKLFFPTADPTTALLLTFGTFGVSYLVRPLGALVIGAYADRAGRRAAMLLSIVIMTIGTGLMAIMPTYGTIGILAPIAVLIARLLQGFAVAGEFGSATAFLVEHSKERKGFFASFQWFGQGLAAVLASLFGVILYGWLTTDQLESWGWRVPFFFGLLIGPIGLYIRKHVGETPEFREHGPATAPVRQMFTGHWDRLLMCIGIVVLSTSSNYIILYMPTYAIKQLHLIAWLHRNLDRRPAADLWRAVFRPSVGPRRPRAADGHRLSAVRSLGLSGLCAAGCQSVTGGDRRHRVLAEPAQGRL